MSERIDYRKTYLLGFGFFAVLLYETLYDNAIPLMLGHFTESNTVIGLIMTIDNYIALLMVPTIGFLSDKYITRFGKRMPYIIVGMPLAAICIFLLPNYLGYVSLIILIIATNISMSLFRSPVIALMPDITPHKQRGRANSIINFVGGFGAVFATLFGMKLFEMREQYPFYLTSGLILIAFIIIYKSIKEKRDVIEYEKQEEGGNIFKNLIEGFKRKEVSLMLFAICSWFIAYNGIKTFFSRYAEEHLDIDPGLTGEILTFMSLPFLIFALPAGLLGVKIGQKKAMMLGLIGVIVAMPILVIFNDTDDLTIIKLGLLLVGISWAFVNINSFPFVANLAPIGKIGAFTGLYYLFSTLANILAPVLLGGVLDLSGFVLGEIWWPIVFVFSAVFFFIAFILLMLIKIDKKI